MKKRTRAIIQNAELLAYIGAATSVRVQEPNNWHSYRITKDTAVALIIESDCKFDFSVSRSIVTINDPT